VFDILDYSDAGAALTDLRGTARVNGVLTIPPDYSRRLLSRNQPKVALIEDNTDSFVSATLAATVGQMVVVDESAGADERPPSGPAVADVVEVYPFVPYVQYLLPGSITMSIFMMVMIGGGIIFIDDKAPRPARRLPGDADYEVRTDCGLQYFRDASRDDGGRGHHDRWIAHRRRAQPARIRFASCAS